jgi:tetratricopeptide (TPR) repeat protein
LENVEFAFSPFYPAELGKMESLRAGVDRAHNESLDALIQMGALGFLAKLALWGVLIFYPLKQLGLIKSRKYFGLSIMGGGVLGVFIPIVFDITPVLSGVTIPLGFLGGLAGYLIVANFKSTSQKLHSHFPIITAIVSALISHFVEIHFGIGTVNTYLYFWVMAAILSVILFKRKSLAKEVTTQPLSMFSILIGVMIAVLIFDFSLLSFKAGAKLWVIPVIIGISWVLAQIFIYLVRPERLTFLNLSGQMLLSLVIAGFFYLSSNFWFRIFVSAQSWNSQNAMVNTTRLSYVVIWFLGFIFVMLIIAAVALYKKTPNKGDVLFSNRLSPLFLLIGFVLISFLIFLNLNSSRADTYLKYGQSCDRKGFLDCAAALFRKAVNLNPKREIFLTNLGSQYLKLAQNATSNSERKDYLKKSESTLKKTYSLNPYDTDHLRNLAVLYRQMIPTESSPEKRIALYQLSDELYGKAVQNFPQNVELINEWAALKLIARESQASRALAKQAIEIDSTYTKSYIRLADTYLMEDRYGDAVAAYNQSRKFRDPDSLDNYIKDIRKMLDRTRIINPLDSDKLRNFASLLRVRSRIAKREETKQEYIRLAEDCYRWASEMEPHNISIRKEWAALKLNNGNPAEARNIINDAIAITPELPDGYLWLAETYSAKSNYNQAIEAYQKALTLDENNLDAWSGIALAYVNLGQLQKALNANREALKIDPNDLITLRNISVLRYQTGDKSGAIDAAKRSLQIAPDDFITLSNAATIFYHTGEMQQALDAAQKAFELAPNEGEKERLKGLIQQINGG